MPKLTEVYDITKKHRSIDPELKRCTLTQFFKSAPDYINIPNPRRVNLLEEKHGYLIVDDEGGLITF